MARMGGPIKIVHNAPRGIALCRALTITHTHSCDVPTVRAGLDISVRNRAHLDKLL